MSVEKIEEYPITGIAKVILKPTKTFLQGWFYTDMKYLGLVERYSWYLHKQNKENSYIVTRKNPAEKVAYHQVLAEKILGYRPDCIDHINGLKLDNIDSNLQVVTSNQNRRNTPTRSYFYNMSSFSPQIVLDKITYHGTVSKSEAEAALNTYYLRQMKYSDYDYDFLKDRRNDLDIVDLQYTGQISEEEATFRHVMRYAKDNAWYVYRYNLFDYFKQYHVPVPEFRLDEQGFMVHPVTGQKLYPF